MSRITVIIGYVASKLLMYNLGQGVVEKFTKLSKIAVKHSMECFTAILLNFVNFSTTPCPRLYIKSLEATYPIITVILLILAYVNTFT